MTERLWCDVAFGHPEVKLRLADARRARGTGPEGVACAVIDVLRATSTIVAALGNGCRRVIPCPSPEVALERGARLRAEAGAGEILLGGEQDARPIAGFDGGNSPREYTPDRIGGRDLVLSTSNGTKALAAADGCGRVLIVSFANLSAAASRLVAFVEEGHARTVLAACSGRGGGYCEEDTVAAGLLLASVEKRLGTGGLDLSETARVARRAAETAGENLGRMLRECAWGRHLAGLGLEEDIAFCARKDWTEVVPEMREGEIQPA